MKEYTEFENVEKVKRNLVSEFKKSEYYHVGEIEREKSARIKDVKGNILGCSLVLRKKDKNKFGMDAYCEGIKISEEKMIKNKSMISVDKAEW